MARVEGHSELLNTFHMAWVHHENTEEFPFYRMFWSREMETTQALP